MAKQEKELTPEAYTAEPVLRPSQAPISGLHSVLKRLSRVQNGSHRFAMPGDKLQARAIVGICSLLAFICRSQVELACPIKMSRLT